MAGKYDKEIKIKVTDGGQLKRTTKDVDKLNKAVNNTTKSSSNFDRNMKGNARMSSNASKNFSKQAQGMQGVLVPAYAEVAARVFALTAAFSALSRASDYRIMLEGQSRFAKMTGKDMGAIARSVQKASNYMLDFAEASKSVALASTAGLAAKQIKKMTKASLDSSTALGRSMTDTMDRLTRGIVKAEPEILDEIGVIIRLDNVYKKFAETLNKTTSDLTEAEKMTARYSAIMGQLGDKFGGIADGNTVNRFEQLRVTVMDLWKDITTKVLPAFDPLMDFFIASKVVLAGIFALIAKNLIGKMFPALKSLGSKIADAPNKMAKSVANLNKQSERLKRTLTSLEKSKISAASSMSAFVNKQTPGKKSDNLARLLGLEDLGKGDSTKKLERSVRAAIGAARANITRDLAKGGKGKATVGMFLGMDRSAIKAFETQFNKQLTSLKKSGPIYRAVRLSLLNLEVGFNKLSMAAKKAQMAIMQTGITMLNAGKRWNKVLGKMGLIGGTAHSLRALSRSWVRAGNKINKVSLRVGIGFQALQGTVLTAVSVMSKAFKGLMGLFSVYAIATMLGSMLFDVKGIVSKARDAIGTLGDSLDKTFKDITNRTYNINFEGLASSFADSIKNSSFQANVSEAIAGALSDAIKQLEMPSDEDTWGNFANFWADLFGAGLADKLEYATSRAFDNLDIRGLQAPMEGIDKLLEGFASNQEGDSKELALAGKQALRGPKEERDKWLAVLQDTEGTETVFQEILKKLQQGESFRADALKTTDSNLKEISETFGKFNKARAKFASDLIEETKYTDMAKAQKGLINLFKISSDKISKQTKILALESQGFLNNTVYTNSIEQLAKLEKYLKDNKHKFSPLQLDNVKSEIRTAKVELKGLAEVIYDSFVTTGGEGAAVIKQMGTDAISIHENLVRQKTTILDLEAKGVQLAKLGASALKEQAGYKQNIMSFELAGMVNSRATGVEEGTLVGVDLEQANKKIELFSQKIADAGVSAVKLGKHLAKVNGTTYTMSQHVKDMRKDFRGSKTNLDNWELETVTAAFNKIKNDTLHIAENTRDTFKEQDKIAVVLSQLQEARNQGLIASDKSLKNYAKLAKLAYTKEGQLLVSKKQVLEDELFILNNSDDYFGKQQVLIDSEKSLLELKRKVTDEALGATRSEVAALMLGVAIKETQNELTKAKLDEEISWLADSMAQTADTFGAALTSVLTDLLLDRDPEKDWQTTIQEGLARSAATIVSGIATDAIFGGKGKSFFNFGSKEGQEDDAGIIHQIAKKWFGVEDAILNVIFPQTQVSILQGILLELKKQTPQIQDTSTSLNEATTARIKFDEKWLEKDDQGLPSGQSERYSQLLTSLGDFKGSAVVDKTTLVNALRAAWEVQESRLLKEGETISAEKEIKASEKIIKAVQAMKPSKFMSDEANKWFIGMDDKLLKFVNAYRDTMGSSPFSNQFETKMENQQTALEGLILELAKVKWGIFAKATENLTAAFVRGKLGGVDEKGEPTGFKQPGFRMYIPGFTEAVGESMKKGMDSLTRALGSEGKIKIQDFNGASLKKASDLIGTTFKGIELETASKDIHTAFNGTAFKVTVMNPEAFDLAEDPSVQSARIYTDVVLPLSKSLNEISTALKSHSEGSTISKASIEELSKAVSASVASIFERNLIDPAATIGALNSSNLSMTRADIAEPTQEMDWAAGQINQGIAPSITKILNDIDVHIKQSQLFLSAMAKQTLDSLDTLIAFDIAVPLDDAAFDIRHFVDVLDDKIVPIMTKLDPVLDKMPELIKEMTITLKAVNDWIGPDTEETGNNSYIDDIQNYFSTKPDISEDTAYRLSGSGRYEDLSDKKKAALENISSRNWSLQTDADLGAEGWTAIPGLKDSFMDGFKTMQGAQLTFAHALLSSIEMLPENSAFFDDPDFFLGKDKGDELKFLKGAKNAKNGLKGFNEGATGTVYISALAEMIKTLIHEKNHSDETGVHFGSKNSSSYNDPAQWDKWFTENKNMYKGLAAKVPTVRTNSSGEPEETKNIHQKRNINTARLYPMNQIVEEILVRTKTALASLPSGTKAEEVISKDVWGILTDKFKEVLMSLETKINLVEGGLQQRFAVLMNVSEKGPGLDHLKGKTLWHDPKSSDRGTFFKKGQKIPKEWEKGINKSEGYKAKQVEKQLAAQKKIMLEEENWRRHYQDKQQKALDKKIRLQEYKAQQDAEYQKNRKIELANKAMENRAYKIQTAKGLGVKGGYAGAAYMAIDYIIDKLKELFQTTEMREAGREYDLNWIKMKGTMPNEGFFRPEGQYESLQKEFDSGAFSEGASTLDSVRQDIMATKGELESLSAPEIYWNMGLEIGRSILEFFNLNTPSTSNTIDDMKADPTHQYINMLQTSIDSNSLILADIAEKSTMTEVERLAHEATSGAKGDGTIKMHMTNAADIPPTTVNIKQNGVPLVTEDPKAVYTTENMSKDIRTSMASNLHAQIMNDNLNAKSLIMNSLATVGSNLMSSAIGSIFGLANGGVLAGGFKAFASGGTVTKPTLGLVGEGKYNEAVVPLPDGRSIPVMGATGSTENNITVNVTIDSDGNAKSDTSSGMNGDSAKQLGYMVSQAVQSELVEQKRPGGLLSQY